jgi:hypothetical protein
MRENMFNHKDKESMVRHCNGSKIYEGSASYIESVKWKNFVADPNKYIGVALEIRKNINEYEIKKNLK